MKRLAIAAVLLAGGATAWAQQADEPTGAGPQGQAAAPAAPAGPPPAPKPITLASRPNASGGEALYIEHCMHCHGPNGMGTGLLARRVEPALLEARDNLPALPRGEVSDAELQPIADYRAAAPHPSVSGGAQ